MWHALERENQTVEIKLRALPVHFGEDVLWEAIIVLLWTRAAGKHILDTSKNQYQLNCPIYCSLQSKIKVRFLCPIVTLLRRYYFLINKIFFSVLVRQQRIQENHVIQVQLQPLHLQSNSCGPNFKCQVLSNIGSVIYLSAALSLKDPCKIYY